MESSSIYNHTSSNQSGRPRGGRPISLSRRVWLQTELDDTKSYYQLILKITFSEKRRIAKLWKKETFVLKDWPRSKLLVIETKVAIGILHNL